MPDVNVAFKADTSNLQNAVGSSKSMLSDFGSAIDGLTGSMKANAGQSDDFASKVKGAFEKVTFGVGTAAIAVTSALLGIGISASNFGEEIRTAAGAFDQSLESMSAVKAIADRSGLSLDEFGKSFNNLRTKARDGDKDVTAALKAIGVSTHDAATMSQEALAVRMAQAFSTAKDSANKAQAGVQLFGDAAAKIVPQLDQGAERMLDLEQAANRAGTVIGPDLSARLQGTATLLQGFKDRMHELAETARGTLLQAFGQFKPAIDGLIQMLSDVVGNITKLVEWFNGLDGAGQRSAETFGILGRAARAFAEGAIDATTYVEELSVRGVQSLARLGLSFDGLSNVVQAFGHDVEAMATTSSDALYKAFHEAIAGVVAAFGDLGKAAKSALSLDFSAAKASVGTFGSDVASVGAKIKAAMSPDLISGTRAAWSQMQAGAAASAKSLDAVIAKLEDQKKAQLALVQSGGVKGGPVAQTRAVGDPSAPDDDGGKRQNQLIQAAFKTAEGEVEAARQGEERKKMLADAGVELHQSTDEQKTASTKRAADDQFAAEKAAWEKVKALKGLTIVQQQEVADKLKAINEASQTETLRLQIQAAEAVQRRWDEVTNRISGAFQGQVDGIIAGTTRIGQAFKNIMTGMLGDAVKFAIGWAARHAETVTENILGINAEVRAQLGGEAAKTSATEAGVAARVASQLAGAAASAAATLKSALAAIGAYAAQAAAAVTAFLAPILGPVSAGAGAAVMAAVTALGAAIPSFAVGAWELPSDTMAMLHKGEMVVPSAPAQAFRAAVAGAAGAPGTAGADGAGGGGSITHNHYHKHTWNVSVAPQPRRRDAVVDEIKSNVRAIGRALNTMPRP